MEEMKYEKISNEKDYKKLFETKIGKYTFIIISYGSHPCAYVGVPKEHPLYETSHTELEESKIWVDCHGGLTYSGQGCEDFHKDKWFFGWDYAHAGDFYYHKSMTSSSHLRDEKKWTTEEIKQEGLNVIKELESIKKRVHDVIKHLYYVDE